MNQVDIQLLDQSNNWRTISRVNGNVASVVRHEMAQVSRFNNNGRIRAVDVMGRIVDIL